MSEQTFALTRRGLISGAASTGLVLGLGWIDPLLARADGKRPPTPDYLPDDEFFGKAYIDIDEWREGPVRFRYVHGGFEGTDARFSFYFPERTQYRRVGDTTQCEHDGRRRQCREFRREISVALANLRRQGLVRGRQAFDGIRDAAVP